jgi:hypothetical protein
LALDSGNGGPAADAEIDLPQNVVVDTAGDLAISDTGADQVRWVAADSCASDCPFGLSSTVSGDIYTIAGGGTGEALAGGPATKVELFGPTGLAVDTAGDVLVSDQMGVWLIATQSCSSGCPLGLGALTAGHIYTVASDDSAGLELPAGLAADADGDVVIADRGKDLVRVVAGADCAGTCPYGLSAMTEGDVYTIAGGGSDGSSPTGYPATKAALSAPTGVAVDASGNLVVADAGDDLVRLIAARTCNATCPYGLGTLTAGDIYTIGGDGSAGYSGDGGPATSAGLNEPTWVAVDGAGDVLVTDSDDWRVRLIAAAACPANCSDGLATTAAGDIYTIAGDGSPGFSGDGGPAVDASVDWNGGGGGLAVDGAGDVLVADTVNDRIRRITANAGTDTVALSAPGLSFGDQVVGETSEPLQETISDAGTTPLEITSVAVTGTQAAAFPITAESCAGHTLEPEGQCTVDIAFAPGSAGTASATLSVADNGAGSPQSVGLSGTGVGPTPELSETGLSFADGSSSAQTVTVTNPGPSPLSIGTPTLSGPQEAAFDIGSDACASVSLLPGHTCTISVTTTAASGISTATLQIPDDAADTVATVSLEAVGLPVFTAANPPLDVASGSSLAYTFATNPASTLTLAAGAPGWLSIDPSTGQLTGTVPVGTTSFSYAVTATDAAGSSTAGPFFVSSTMVTVTGTVTSEGDGISGAIVDACLSSGGMCFTATTTSSGAFTVDALPDTSMVLTVYPPTDLLIPLASSATDPITIPPTGLTGESLTLSATNPVEDFELLGPDPYGTPGSPVLVTSQPTPVSVTGCGNGIATVTTIGQDSITGDFTDNVDVLPQTSAGTYEGILPPESPIHGPVQITTLVDCPPPDNALAPSVGPASGGTTVTLTGSGFTGTTGVDFGGTPARSFTVISDDAIQAVAPAGTGAVPVTVFGGSAPAAGTVVDQYTYQSVDSVSPSTGPSAGGTWVIVDGAGLTSATEVLFGSTPAPSFYVLSDSELEALSPPGSGTQDITVQTLWGGTTPTSVDDQFTYGTSGSVAGRGLTTGSSASDAAVTDGPLTPVLKRRLMAVVDQQLDDHPLAFHLSVPPVRPITDGERADAAAIARGVTSGGSLTAIALQFVYQYGSTIYNSEGVIEDAVDLALEKAYPSCDTNEQALAAFLDLAVTPSIDLLIESILPSVLAAETAALFETGPALLALYAVTPLALEYAFSQVANAIINAAVASAFGDCKKKNETPPPGGDPGSGFGDGGGGGAPGAGGGGGGGFGGVNPNAYIDPGGNVLDTNGNPISGATVTILRSDVWAGPFTALSPAQPGILPAVNPETTDSDGSFDWDVYSGYYEIRASAPGCTSVDDPSDDDATIGPYPVPPPQLGLVVTMACADESAAPTPVVQGLSVAGGPAGGGTPVTILGTGFTPLSTVSFGGVPASGIVYASPEALTAVSPAGTGMADVVVRTAGASSATSAADEFYYGSPPTVTGVSVAQGPSGGGTVLTVYGTGFTGATVVGFGGIPGSALDVESDTELTVTAPAEEPGTVDVVVDTPAGGSTVNPSDEFTFLPPPAPGTPSSGSPSSGSPASGSPASGSPSTGASPSSGAAPTTAGTSPAVLPPELTGVSLTAVRLLESRPRHGRPKLPVGTTVRFTLTEAGSVVLHLTRLALGHHVGKRCVNAPPGRSGGHRCTVSIPAGTVAVNGRAGANAVTFSGRVSGRLLPAGNNMVRLTESTSSGSATSASLRFTIVA